MKKLIYMALLGVCCCVGNGCSRTAPSAEVGRYQMHEGGSSLAIFDTATGCMYILNTNKTWLVVDPVNATSQVHQHQNQQ